MIKSTNELNPSTLLEQHGVKERYITCKDKFQWPLNLRSNICKLLNTHSESEIRFELKKKESHLIL